MFKLRWTQSGQDATNTEQATLVDAETQTEEFDNKVIGQDAMETEQATMLDEETQTEEFDYLFHKPNRYSLPDIDFFDTDDKIRFYTGLPTKEILITTFQHVAPHVPGRSTTLNNFQEFVLVLMKLRLKMRFQELAFRFGVNVTTISRIFSCWIMVMDVRLALLIFWPERDQLWKTMPVCFQCLFGKKVTVIIDCFEVFIEKPSNLLAGDQTFSNYKHHNTIKILIGITPQGSISFVSESWGGCTSGKFLTENCRFLDKLVPGDVVMADRGFTVAESVGMSQARLVIPALHLLKEKVNWTQ